MSDFAEYVLFFGVLTFICGVIYLLHRRNKIKIDNRDYYSGIALVTIIMVIVMLLVLILKKGENCLLVKSGLHLVLIMIGANIIIPIFTKSQCCEKVEEGKFDYITVLFLIALLSNAVCAWFYFDSEEVFLTYLSIILGKFIWFDAEGMTPILCKSAKLVENGLKQLKQDHKFMLLMEVIACVAIFGGLIYQKYDQTGTALQKSDGALVGVVVGSAAGCLVFILLKYLFTRNRQGIYLNPGNNEFGRAIHAEIYVDETDMISYANEVICTEQKYVCASCQKGFGQPLLAEMLVAYYSRGCKSKKMFKDLKVARCMSYARHINKYNVIILNMQEFLNESNSIDETLRLLNKMVYSDLFEQYPEYCNFAFNNSLLAMREVYQKTKCPFVVIIDEWDCVTKKYIDHAEYKKYVEFLKKLILYTEYIALVYMTGTVPINMYGTYYKLDEFNDFSIMNSQQFAEFIECDELVK